MDAGEGGGRSVPQTLSGPGKLRLVELGSALPSVATWKPVNSSESPADRHRESQPRIPTIRQDAAIRLAASGHLHRDSRHGRGRPRSAGIDR